MDAEPRRLYLCVVWGVLLVLLTGCALIRTPPVTKIALLAPFEGRYRAIGYDALYAARLALRDSGATHIFLTAIDDGGRVDSASQRAQAIQQDDSIALVLASGMFAAHPTTQRAYGDVPVIVIGHWHTRPTRPNVYLLTHPTIDDAITFREDDILALDLDASPPIVGSELLALPQVPDLYDDLSAITVISSGSPPPDAFRQRYMASDIFVPEPTITTTLAYDAMTLAIDSLQRAVPVGDLTHEGLNGTIRFEDGYWVDAPINRYAYVSATLDLLAP